MLSCWFYSVLMIMLIPMCEGFGYDSGTDQAACGKPLRSGKSYKPPCDLQKQAFCTSAGSTYPWHAVRRFIRENQGLMKRMYGSERQITILRAELESNELDDYDYDYQVREFKSRYSKQDPYFENDLFHEKDTARYLQENSKKDEILNTKFIYSEEPNLSVKLGDLKTMPHFRPTTQKNPIDKNVKPNQVASNANQTKTFDSTNVLENVTEITPNIEESNSSTSTEEIVEKTTTEFVEETTTILIDETTTEESKKNPSGAVLFQDMDDTNKIPTNMNFKLRGVNACPVKEEVVAPFWANNTRGEVLALLNLYPFEQYVHWEKCTFEHRQMYCREGCRCEQQYRLHRLLAYDPKNECRGIFSDWFRFPSCCVCKCYDMPPEFRVTSRSPRSKDDRHPVPSWFKKKNRSSED